jgi:hypothetical protein
MGDQLDLSIGAHQCIVAACGSCAYDFHFDVAPIDTSGTLEVALEEASCSDEDPKVLGVSLPLDTQSEGVRCRFLGAVGFDQKCGIARAPRCTADYSPSNTACDDENARLCGEGLVCVDGLDSSRGICVTACESDQDCPLDIESCQSGACLLRESL